MRIFILVMLLACAAPMSLLAAEASQRGKPIFAIGYDFLTRQDAVDVYTNNLDYEQDDAGFTLSMELPLASGDGLVFEYRDAGQAHITCYGSNGYVDIDDSRYYCLSAGVTSSEASSMSASYKYYTPTFQWKLGIGFSFIEYLNSSIPNRDKTGMYIGWTLPINQNDDGSGLNLDFGAVLGNTFGIGLQYRFGN